MTAASSAVTELTTATFNDFLTGEGLRLVEFGAPWCGPCRAMAPVLGQIADERSDVAIATVNTDEYIELAARYGITSVPTLHLFRDGVIVASATGGKPKPALNALIDANAVA